MGINWLIIDVICCAIESILIAYLFCSYLNTKGRAYIFVGAFCLFLAICANTLFITNIYYRMCSNLFAWFIYASCAYKGSITIRFVLTLLPMIIAGLSESIAMNVLASSSFSMEFLMEPSSVRFQFQVLTLAVSMLLYYVVTNMKKHTKLDLQLPYIIRIYLLALFIIACVGIQQSGDLSIWMNINSIGFEKLKDVLIISITIIMLTIGLFVFTIWLGNLHKENLDRVLEANRVKSQLQNIENAEAVMETLRVHRHDMVGHLETMATLINNSEWNELKTYFEQYSSHIDASTAITFTNIPPLDATLAVKRSMAGINNIKFSVICKPNIRLPLEPVETCSLIGNMLDNAIEACLKVPEMRYINLTIVEYKKQIIITIENSAYNVTEIVRGKSEKAYGEHGLGIKQICNLAKKAGGFLNIDALGNKVVATVILPIKEEA